MKLHTLLLASASLVFGISQGVAQTTEEAAAACTEAARLIVEDDLAGALDEANWCVESLQQMKQQAMLNVFPDTVASYAGGDIGNQSAMGMTILEREYTGADGVVSVSLTTGIAGGGLAALAQLGMGLTSGGGKKLRIQKRTVLDLGDSSEGQYMVQLKSGATLAITSEELNAEQLLPFVKAFPIAELDDALSE
jgi:hypothetical protein